MQGGFDIGIGRCFAGFGNNFQIFGISLADVLVTLCFFQRSVDLSAVFVRQDFITVNRSSSRLFFFHQLGLQEVDMHFFRRRFVVDDDGGSFSGGR